MPENILRVNPKLYVRYNRGDKGLAGLIDFEKEDSSFRSRKASLDRWTNAGAEVYYDNDPQIGHRLIKSVSRWRTSNKWFEIEDPRGFIVQISAACLVDLLHTETIEKGVFKTPLVWAKTAQSYVLLSPQDVEEKIESIIPIKDLKIGDRVIFSSNSRYGSWTPNKEHVYLGEFYIHRWYSIVTSDWSGYSYYGNKHSEPKMYLADWEETKVDKYHIFSYHSTYQGGSTWFVVCKSAKIQSVTPGDPPTKSPNTFHFWSALPVIKKPETRDRRYWATLQVATVGPNKTVVMEHAAKLKELNEFPTSYDRNVSATKVYWLE